MHYINTFRARYTALTHILTAILLYLLAWFFIGTLTYLMGSSSFSFVMNSGSVVFGSIFLFIILLIGYVCDSLDVDRSRQRVN